MTIGNVIIELRKEQGSSQQKLADAIGVSQSTIAQIEKNRNEATASTIRKLATFFNVSADYLLGLEDDFGARTAAPMSDGLTSEERKLIAIYKSLSSDMRDTLWSLLATWSPETSFDPTKLNRH